MANILLAYPNRADEAVLTGGAWSAGLPLGNLQNKDLQRYARTASTAPSASRFTLAFTVPRAVRLVALCNANLSRDATYRMRWATDAAITDVVADSGVLDVYPAGIVPAEQIEWEEANFWDARVSEEQLAYYPRDLIHMFSSNLWGQYLSVELIDSANPAGFVQAGRLFVGKGFQSAYNASYGITQGHSNTTTVTETLSRRELFGVKPQARETAFDLEWLTPSEAQTLFDAERLGGVHGELFYVRDADDPVNRMRTSFLGRMQQLSALTHPMFGIHKKTINLKEIL